MKRNHVWVVEYKLMPRNRYFPWDTTAMSCRVTAEHRLDHHRAQWPKSKFRLRKYTADAGGEG